MSTLPAWPARRRVRSSACIAAFVLLQLGTIQLPINARLLAQAATQVQERESALDRSVHIEPELILEIPRTPRWEEQLDLVVRRVSVGDAELYVEEEGSGVPMVLLHGGPGGAHLVGRQGAEPQAHRDLDRLLLYCGHRDAVDPGPALEGLEQVLLDAGGGEDGDILAPFEHAGEEEKIRVAVGVELRVRIPEITVGIEGYRTVHLATNADGYHLVGRGTHIPLRWTQGAA